MTSSKTSSAPRSLVCFLSSSRNAWDGRDDAHVSGHRLHDHRGHFAAAFGHEIGKGRDVIIRQGHGVLYNVLGHAGAARNAQGGHSAAGLDQQGVGVAVIAAVEFDDHVAAGEAARQPQGGHGGFGARIHHAHQVHAGYGVHDHARHFHFTFGGRAVARALFQRFLHRFDHRRVGVAQYHGAPGADVIHEIVSIHVVNMRSLGASDKQRCAAHRFARPHRAVDAAGDNLFRLHKQIFRRPVVHDADSSLFCRLTEIMIKSSACWSFSARAR